MRATRALVLAFLTAFVGFASLASAQVNHHFFPLRPAHVSKMLTAVGTLVSYGSGNDMAGLALRGPRGRLDRFYLASPSRIDGKRVEVYGCAKGSDCVPANIHFGSTRVCVTYWRQKAPWGTWVQVSDELTTSRTCGNGAATPDAPDAGAIGY